MTRDEIYDHLAQVYLGKRKTVDKKKKRQFSAWLIINLLIAGIIFASVSYGLSAFLKQKNITLENNVVYYLHQGSVRIEYNFKNSLAPEKQFSLSVPHIDIERYKGLSFFIRAKEEGSPGVLKVVVTNQRNEESFFYVRGIDLQWNKVEIPFEKFDHFSDWSTLKDISFVLESWNVDKIKGIVLLEDISFFGINPQPEI